MTIKLKDLMRVTSKGQLVWLNENEFLSKCTCEICEKESIMIEHNDDGQNFLGMSICINH